MTASVVTAAPDWKTQLSSILPLYGHRNWIVVADSAYPTQSKPGIETVVSGADKLDAVRHVFDAIAACAHVRANVYVDRELAFVSEEDAPGISDYRRHLEAVLHGAQVAKISHDRIIAKLDESAQVFNILIIKTEMTIPYTSVFFELDCGYWNADAEQRLRHAIAASDSK